jgi:glucose/mannose transport system permease protein
MAIYCVVIAGIWQSRGFRDGAVPGRPARHRRQHHQGRPDRRREPAAHLLAHHLPILRPVLFSTIMVLSHLSIKSFDLIMALTGGGPGFRPTCRPPSCT